MLILTQTLLLHPHRLMFMECQSQLYQAWCQVTRRSQSCHLSTLSISALDLMNQKSIRWFKSIEFHGMTPDCAFPKEFQRWREKSTNISSPTVWDTHTGSPSILMAWTNPSSPRPAPQKVKASHLSLWWSFWKLFYQSRSAWTLRKLTFSNLTRNKLRWICSQWDS